jgi:hypothetical protein
MYLKKFFINLFKKIKKFIKYFFIKLGYSIVKNNLSDNLIPIEATAFEVDLINKTKKYSMTDHKNLYLSTQAIKYIAEANIAGDVVECGVWKGGHLIIFKLLCEKYNLKKKLYGFDTFQGMTGPSNIDIDYKGNKAIKILKETPIDANDGDNIWCYSPLDEVKRNIGNICGNIENINFINGDVEKTLREKKNLPFEIALLRLDTDFYESTKIELEILYPLLQDGGILIIDDYGYWNGARKAVDEYFANIPHFKHVINHSCRMIIKKKF